jgi:hypothetical protein
VEAPEARGRHGTPSGRLTLGREATRWASGGGERSSVAALGVRDAQGEESWGAWHGEVEAGGRGDGR